MTSILLIQGCIREKKKQKNKKQYEAVFEPGGVRFTPSKAPPLTQTHKVTDGGSVCRSKAAMN